jgi:hypothetical protein
MGKKVDKRASNVQLTPEQIEYYRSRFNAKTYTTCDCIPMSPRQAAEIEVKYGMRKKGYEPEGLTAEESPSKEE